VEASFAEPFKSWAQIAGSLGTLAAFVAGAIWFVRTSKYRQRVQFDLDCKTYTLPTNPEVVVCEIQFIFENKGFVEHRMFHLTVSIHSLKSETDLEVLAETGELQFADRVLAKTEIVPRSYGYYFVRPGVRQVITRVVPIPVAASMIRVTAGFQYDRKGKYLHTVRRIFPISTALESSSAETT
jgi:hypothetical protein